MTCSLSRLGPLLHLVVEFRSFRGQRDCKAIVLGQHVWPEPNSYVPERSGNRYRQTSCVLPGTPFSALQAAGFEYAGPTSPFDLQIPMKPPHQAVSEDAS